MSMIPPSRVASAPPRVFVSSTYYDLKSIRQELISFLKDMGMEPVLFELAGALPNFPAPDSALQHAAQADICLLIVGARYGSTAESASISYTHNEYRTAKDQGRPIFAFVEKETLMKFEMYTARSKSDFWTAEERNLFRFVDEISGQGSRFPFDSISHLKEGIRYQLASYFGYLIREFSKLQTITPEHAAGWITMGNNLLNKRGDFGGAIYCYRRALELEPDSRSALENLGRTLRVTGRSKEAIPLLEKGRELYPGTSAFPRELVWALSFSGNEEKALDLANRIGELFPDDPRVFDSLAQYYWKLGRRREAALAAKRAHEMEPTNVGYRNLYQTNRIYLELPKPSDTI